MDYKEFVSKKVMAYFTEDRKVFVVEGTLESINEFSHSGDGDIVFRDANVTVLTNGDKYEPSDLSNEIGNQSFDDMPAFSKARFRECKLVGICEINLKEDERDAKRKRH